MPATLRYLPSTAVKMGSGKVCEGHKRVVKNGNIPKLTGHEAGAARIVLLYIGTDVQVITENGALDFTTSSPDLVKLHVLLSGAFKLALTRFNGRPRCELTLSSPSLILVECILAES